MKNKITVVFCTLLLLLVSFASALEIKVAVGSKDSFGVGEDVGFDYTITSDEEAIITYLPYVECPTAPMPLLIEKFASLEKDAPYTSSFTAFTVDDFVEPQACTAYIQIMEPIEMVEARTVEITVDPSFSFELLVCEDINCNEKSKVFVQGATSYLDYSSGAEAPAITATVKSPDGVQQSIALPMPLELNQLGTYVLEASASKEGYKTNDANVMFGAIEKEVEIKDEDPVPVEPKPSPGGSTFSITTVAPSGGGAAAESEPESTPEDDEGKAAVAEVSGEGEGAEGYTKATEEQPSETIEIEKGTLLKEIVIILAIVVVLLAVIFYRVKKA